MAEVGQFICILLCLTETSCTMNDKNTKQAPKQITEWNSVIFQKFFRKKAQPQTISGIIPLRTDIPTKQKSPSCCCGLKTAIIWEKGKKSNLGKWHISR